MHIWIREPLRAETQKNWFVVEQRTCWPQISKRLKTMAFEDQFEWRNNEKNSKKKVDLNLWEYNCAI